MNRQIRRQHKIAKFKACLLSDEITCLHHNADIQSFLSNPALNPVSGSHTVIAKCKNTVNNQTDAL